MNYILLKGILDATISHFVCRGCDSRADDRSVDIGGIQDSTLMISIRCPQCGLVSHVKAEVNMVGGINLPRAESDDFSQKTSGSLFDSVILGDATKKMSANTRQSISDEEIVKLRDSLNDSVSASDLFGNSENN